MEWQKLVGGIMALGGIIWAFYGISDLNSLPSKMMEFVGVSNTNAYVAIFGGITIAIIGLALMLSKRRFF